jgi:hypothetical protein
MSLPKPQFKTCDETSLTISWENFDPQGAELRLEYKKYGEEWERAKFVIIKGGSSEARIVDVVDLDPGTPYFMRLATYVGEQIQNPGPECVFDTKPIDCTPKKKNCIIA